LWKCVTVKYAPCYPRKAPVPTQNTDTRTHTHTHTHTHMCKKKKTALWMNTMSCCKKKKKMKTCNEMRMLSCVRNVTEVLSDRQCSLFSPLKGNRTAPLLEYVNILGLGHTHTHTWLSASAHLPTTHLLYTFPAIQLLTTPTCTSPLLSSANTSPPLHPTAHNYGYCSVADYSSAAILSPGLCACSPENDEKGKKLWVHTYRTVSSR
jgi:hypothetical protein